MEGSLIQNSKNSETKRCFNAKGTHMNACGIIKPLSEFGAGRSTCKSCVTIYNKNNSLKRKQEKMELQLKLQREIEEKNILLQNNGSLNYYDEINNLRNENERLQAQLRGENQKLESIQRTHMTDIDYFNQEMDKLQEQNKFNQFEMEREIERVKNELNNQISQLTIDKQKLEGKNQAKNDEIRILKRELDELKPKSSP